MTTPTNEPPIEPGDILQGHCNGFFGSMSYGDKVVEAVGPDWIVARDEIGFPVLAHFAGMPPGTMAQYVSEWVKEDNGL